MELNYNQYLCVVVELCYYLKYFIKMIFLYRILDTSLDSFKTKQRHKIKGYMRKKRRKKEKKKKKVNKIISWAKERWQWLFPFLATYIFSLFLWYLWMESWIFQWSYWDSMTLYFFTLPYFHCSIIKIVWSLNFSFFFFLLLMR